MSTLFERRSAKVSFNKELCIEDVKSSWLWRWRLRESYYDYLVSWDDGWLDCVLRALKKFKQYLLCTLKVITLMECNKRHIFARGIQISKIKKLTTHIATIHHGYRRLLRLIEDVFTTTRRIYQRYITHTKYWQEGYGKIVQ